jgi:hypothetical protein
MKYIKEYYSDSSNNVDDISNTLFNYMKSFSSVNSYSGNIKEILYNTNRHIGNGYQIADPRNPTLDEIKYLVRLMIHNKRLYGYNQLMEYYPLIVDILKSHNTDIDEIEDLFLSIGYKCEISKEAFDQRIKGKIVKNSPGFNIKIEDVKKSDIRSISESIWGSVTSRLSDEYYVSKSNITENAKGSYNVEIVISKPIRWDKD